MIILKIFQFARNREKHDSLDIKFFIRYKSFARAQIQSNQIKDEWKKNYLGLKDRL
jgi:hypothetical protein